MKKIFLILFGLFFMFSVNVNAAMIQGGISMSDQVPKEFFGDWKVVSVCTKATDSSLLNTKSLDIWVLSRMGQTISLSNPLSGATAQIDVDEVNGKTVKFEKRGYYPNEESIETPILTLQGDNFTGVDKIIIKTYQNGKLIKEDYVEYKVKGIKMKIDPITGIFGI